MSERVLYVEQTLLHNMWRTVSVITETRQYDVEWCERDGCSYGSQIGGRTRSVEPGRLVNEDGSTALGCHRVWAASEVSVIGDPEENGFVVLDAMPDGSDFEEVEHVCWCVLCEDAMPDDYLCDHVWWCDTVGWFVGPGTNDPPCESDCPSCQGGARE